MDNDNPLAREWFIVFRKTGLKHWIFRWLDSELQHCYAVTRSEGGLLWIIADGKNSYMQIRTESTDVYPTVRDMEPNGVILRVNAIIDPNKFRWSPCLFTCVDVCKSILGIKDFWCWTPYQLYKRLSRG